MIPEKAMQAIGAALDAYINGERQELRALMDISRIVGRYEMELTGVRQVIPVAAQNAALLVLASRYPNSGLVYSEEFTRALNEALEAATQHLLQDAINAAHERQQWAQQGVFMRKRGECPPRTEGDNPHCPDCPGVVGESGIVW